MKNNFVATFILLAAGLVFNDVASVHGKPTKRDRRLQQQDESVDNAIRSLGGESVDNAYPNGANIYPNVDTRSLVNEAQDNAMKALGD